MSGVYYVWRKDDEDPRDARRVDDVDTPEDAVFTTYNTYDDAPMSYCVTCWPWDKIETFTVSREVRTSIKKADP